ncbi:MAG: hypothetical protein KTR31_22945 [Myxococcales bacterium]|nr:hypothetical protein [Myxococcales bacterium]
MIPAHRLALLMLLPLAACSGPATDVAAELPEICGDGIDNNDNGLVDCEDATYCGGPGCAAPPPTDEGFDTDQLVFPGIEDLNCDFSFGTTDCSRKELCTFTFENTSPDPATFNAECSTPAGGGNKYDSAILFQVQGDNNAAGRVSREPADAGETVLVTLYYDCFVAETFNVDCEVRAEGTDGVIPLLTTENFEIQGTFIE